MRLLNILNDKKKWLILFFATYAAAFYWLPEVLPLFYSQALPEDRLASKYYLLILPLSVFLLFQISDFFLIRLALKNEAMLNLIKFFRIGYAVFSYIIFVKIIVLVI